MPRQLLYRITLINVNSIQKLFDLKYWFETYKAIVPLPTRGFIICLHYDYNWNQSGGLTHGFTSRPRLPRPIQSVHFLMTSLYTVTYISCITLVYRKLCHRHQARLTSFIERESTSRPMDHSVALSLPRTTNARPIYCFFSFQLIKQSIQ